jgi:uncharacterized protein (TIGR02466 family)
MSPEIKNIFPTPVMIFDVQDHKRHKNDIMYYAEDPKETYPMRKKTKGNILALEEFNDLRSQIKEYCVQYFRLVCGIYVKPDDIIIFNSWLNCISNTVSLQKHVHRNSHISGVYYVNYDPKLDPPLTFHRETMYDLGNVLESYLSMEPEGETPYNTYSHKLKINEGQLCMFNSYLCHSHSAKETLGNRVSLAFNCVLSHYTTGNNRLGKQYEIFIKEID